MIGKIFSEPPFRVEELRSYQQLAALRRSRYDALQRAVALIEDEEEAKDIYFAYQEFTKEFNENVQKVEKYLQDNEIDKARELIKKYDEILGRVEPVYRTYKEKITPVSPSEEMMRELKIEQEEIINELNTTWRSLQTSLTDRIDRGMASLNQFKQSLGVTAAFKGQIAQEIKRNNRAEWVNFSFFILCLLLIPISIILIHLVVPQFEDLKGLIGKS